MDKRARDLVRRTKKLFSKRDTLMSMWQESAELFFPQRADFTRALSDCVNNADSLVERSAIAGNLYTSYPMLMRSELSTTLRTMLQPVGREWFYLRTRSIDDDNLQEDERAWLEQKTKVQRALLIDDPRAQFAQATSLHFDDLVAFGQAVTSLRLSRRRTSLLTQCWHLRDVVWADDEDGEICIIARRSKTTCGILTQRFPKTVDPDIRRQADLDPDSEVKVEHIVIAADDYDMPNPRKMPWVSIWIDPVNEVVLEELPQRTRGYVISRWQKMPPSQYAFSPGIVAALPEGRMLQAMAAVLDASEKATAPPMIAYRDAIQGEIAAYANGVTYVDVDYDARSGKPIERLEMDTSGIRYGMQAIQDSRALLMKALFVDKLSMPSIGANPQMTAFEVGQRIQEFVRDALPLLAPLEQEVNAQICDEAMELILWSGGFGGIQEIPRRLQQQSVTFGFRSPLHDSIDSVKQQKFLTAAQLEQVAAQMPPTSRIDPSLGLKDALHGAQVPAKWMRTDEQLAAIEASMMQQQAMMQAAQVAQAGAGAMADAGAAAQRFAQAQQISGGA